MNFSPALLLAAVSLAVFGLTTFSIPVKAARGYVQAADTVLAGGLPEHATTLVSSDPIGEGAFVAQIAGREPNPEVIVIRGSKLLASSTWMNLHYKTKYSDVQKVREVVDRARVEYVVVDNSISDPHHVQLLQVVEGSPDWEPLSSPARVTPMTARVYHRRRALPPGEPVFELDLGYSIRETLRP